jgi:hypothetical protein
LVVAIATSTAFAVTHDGVERVLALVGGGGFLVVLVASLVVMVPLQRRIIDTNDPEAVGEMRERWCGGSLGRSSLSVVAFAVTALAAAAG